MTSWVMVWNERVGTACESQAYRCDALIDAARMLDAFTKGSACYEKSKPVVDLAYLIVDTLQICCPVNITTLPTRQAFLL